MTLDAWVKIAIALVAALIFIVHSALTIRLHRRDIAVKKKVYELDLQKWKKGMDTATSMSESFSPHIPLLAVALKHELTKELSWLEAAGRKARFIPFENATFGKRTEHFSEEKEQIAKIFSHKIVEYIKHKLAGYRKVFLFIDSGTTLFPFFEQLAYRALLETDNSDGKNWVNRLEIFTNNLPGVYQLMRPSIGGGFALRVPPIKCTLLAGQPLTEYAAITGPDTEQFLEEIYAERRRNTGDDCYFIALVTGNWIRLRKTNPICPVPLARGKGHLEIKQLVCSLSDEIFVVAPLGKIFIYQSLEDINLLLNNVDGAEELSHVPYKEIETDADKLRISPEKMRLVTTFRTNPHQILRSHSIALAHRFREKDVAVLEPGGEKGMDALHLQNLMQFEPVLIPFNLRNNSEQEQLRIEFPHGNTHTTECVQAFSISKLPV